MKNTKIIDLTQTISEGIPDWNGCCGFQMKNVMDYNDGLRAQEIRTPNGVGTHMDAPSHFFKNSLDISAISLERLLCPGVVINVTKKADQNYAISKEDIVDFERKNGEIAEGSIVIGYTGWGSHWDCANDYRNEDVHGRMHFPKFSLESIEYLLTRNINGIAIDTLSPDGSDYSFPVHHKLLGSGKFIVENIKIMEALPEMNFTVIALPLKISGATEAPCRVVALISE